jgi:hypothetical protein
VETFVAEPSGSSGIGKGGQPIFPKKQFVYDAVQDTYCCPAGGTLEQIRQDTNHGKVRLLYYNEQACQQCALRSQCTTGAYRVISRRSNEAVVERAAERALRRADLLAARKEIVEHVFGTLRNWAHDLFLLRGLAKVRGEFSLSATVYNLRRVLNLVSMERLLQTVAGAAKSQ